MTEPPVRRTGVWLLIAASFAASFAFVAWRFIGPSDGAPVSFYAGAWQANGIRVDPPPADNAGNAALQPLRAGDVVLAINHRSVNDWLADAFDPLAARPAGAQSDPTYTVARDGATTDVVVPLVPRFVANALVDNLGNLLFGAVLLGVAVYLLRRRPDLPASVALAIAATGAGASVTPWFLGLSVSDIYFGWPFLLQLLTVNVIYMLLWPAGAIHLPLGMAPRGSGLPAMTRRVTALVYGLPLGGYALALAAGLVASPSLTAWVATWPTVQGLVIIPTVVVGLVVAGLDFRAADSALRRQIRWALVGATAATVLGVLLLFLPQVVLGHPLIPWNFIGLIALPAPIGLAYGIVRRGLFDIDVVVNRTLVYGGLTLAVVGLYALTVVFIGLMPAGAGFPTTILATGLAAIAALPVRDRLQRGVNRLMYGDRDEPYRALARLARRLESTIEPLAIPSAIVESVAEALRLPYVALEIGPTDQVELTATHGQPTATATRELPLVYGAETVGRLILGQRAPTESFNSSDLRLLDDLARSAGAAVRSVRLTLDIVRARERTVAAREEERRRIRRDLHDGLGPSLAAIGMRAELAADLAASDPQAAEQTLQQLSTEVRGAVTEIRRLVEGLRPPSLDERGLVGAIQAQADRLGPRPAFTVTAQQELPELPAAVEVAAYRIAVEAMTNAARHAGAHDCRVAIRLADDGQRELRLEISDDGAGLSANAKPGIGLTSMRERAVEVGGSLDVAAGTGGNGTTITARLPLGAAASVA